MVSDAAALVKYQKDSIVSRSLLKKESGDLTVFAFDKGQALGEHTVPFEAYIYILEGIGLITVSGKEYSVSQGQSIVLPAGKPHSVRADVRFKMMLFLLR
jgi:quercetin dioxygenase-like cupin family protein